MGAKNTLLCILELPISLAVAEIVVTGVTPRIERGFDAPSNPSAPLVLSVAK